MLVNLIFAKPVIPESRYLIDKLFNPSNNVTFHALCTECGMNIGTFKSSDKEKHCPLCNISIDVKDNMYKDFFVTMNPSSRIADLLKSNSSYYNNIMFNRQPDNVIRYIYMTVNYTKRLLKIYLLPIEIITLLLLIIRMELHFSKVHNIQFGQFIL